MDGQYSLTASESHPAQPEQQPQTSATQHNPHSQLPQQHAVHPHSLVGHLLRFICFSALPNTSVINWLIGFWFHVCCVLCPDISHRFLLHKEAVPSLWFLCPILNIVLHSRYSSCLRTLVTHFEHLVLFISLQLLRRLIISVWISTVCACFFCFVFFASRTHCQLLFSLATPNSITSPRWTQHLRAQLSRHHRTALRCSRYTTDHFHYTYQIRNLGVVGFCLTSDTVMTVKPPVIIMVRNHTSVGHNGRSA